MSAQKKKTTPAAAGTAGADWRATILDRVRALMTAADPAIVETAKWKKTSNNMRGVPVWEKGGIICTGETYKDKVKLTFAKGAALPDPAGLFNAGLDGGVRRAIDIRAGDHLDEKALVALIRAAAVLNAAVEKSVRPRKKI